MKILSTVNALLLTVGASAQCFEPNFGTVLGSGDDLLLPVAPLNMTFPIGGLFPTYTHVQAGTNGVMYLTNGGESGASATGYSSVSSVMVNNLRGVIGLAPRIAPYWQDLDMRAANNGAVWINNTTPGRCVVTWANAVHYTETLPVFTVQAQLFVSGEVRFFYSSPMQNTSICPIVGVSQGNGVANVSPSDLSRASSGVSTSRLVYETFGALHTFDLQNTTVAFVPNANGGYDVSPTACVPATNTNYGTGCVGASGTFYENFPTSGFDLALSSFTMTPSGSGYAVAASARSPLFTHTTAGLAMTDDRVVAVALPSTFNYPGGSTTSLHVCSNGYIWMQPNTQADWSPTPRELFSQRARLCPLWCNLRPDGPINVANVFAEHDVASNVFYVTWLNVPTAFPGGVATVQVGLDLTTGGVRIQYGSCSVPSPCVVGWAPGMGVSTVDPGSRDLSATLGAGFFTSASEIAALGLSVAPSPILGTTVTWTTSNIPATALFGQLYISAAQQTPGLDLTPLGAPGCLAHIQFGASLSVPVVGTGTVAIPLPVPNDPSLADSAVFSQTIAVNLPSNLLGVITSNGVRSYLKTY